MKILRDNRPLKIRLHGIACPERRQPFGTQARLFTSGLMFGKTVTVAPIDIDRYGRTVARIFVNGADVNQVIVKAGFL